VYRTIWVPELNKLTEMHGSLRIKEIFQKFQDEWIDTDVH